MAAAVPARVRDLVGAVRAVAAKAGDPKRAEGAAKYFKHVCLFYGLSTAQIEAIHASHVKGKLDTGADVLSFSSALLADAYHEMKHLGVFTLYKAKALLNVDRAQADSTVAMISTAFEEGHIADWATCDTIAGRVLAENIRKYGDIAKVVAAWKASPVLWKQRASAVAFLKLCDPAFGYKPMLYDVCATIIKSPERFVQLGCGWLLREMSLHYREETIEFLQCHYSSISREGLRYALEKLDPEARAALMKYKPATGGAGQVVSGVKRKRAPA